LSKQEVFINRMPGGVDSTVEQLAGGSQVVAPKVEQPEQKPHVNGVLFDVQKKQEQLARVFGIMGLTDEVYDEFVARGRAGASFINGDSEDPEVWRANCARMSGGESKPQSTSTNGKDTSKGNGGVGGEDKRRDQIDPQLH
jgi:hypothetical protein